MVDLNNPLTKKMVVNKQGKTTTLKVMIPAIVRDILELKEKDELIFELHPETRSVTLTKYKKE